MALLSPQLSSRPLPHTLRQISLALVFPGSIILLIHGILAEHAVPAVGIIPLFFSALYSALLLYNERKCGCLAGGLTGTPLHLAADLVLFGATLVCFICGSVVLGGRCRDCRLAVLGTWGTVFLMIGMLIHAYFVLTQLQDSLTPGSRWPMSCPQCQGVEFSFTFGYEVGQIQLPARAAGLKNGYAPLLDEGEPRVSSEGEVPEGTEGQEMV